MTKEERQQRAAEKAARKAGRSWPARHWLLSGIGLAVLAILIATVASSGKSGQPTVAASGKPVSSASGETAGKVLQHPEDVTISRCAPDDAGFADAKVKVVNHSAKASDYVITIAFESPNGSTQIGTGDAVVNSLQPGQSTTVDANSLQTASGPFICKVSDAERTASAF